MYINKYLKTFSKRCRDSRANNHMNSVWGWQCASTTEHTQVTHPHFCMTSLCLRTVLCVLWFYTHELWHTISAIERLPKSSNTIYRKVSSKSIMAVVTLAIRRV